MSLSSIHELEKILLRLNSIGGGGGNLEQRVVVLENQVNSINNTNSNQDSQIASIVQINTTQDQQLQDIQNELTNINSINNRQSNRLTNLESQVTSINNTDNQQNSRLTNLETQVSTNTTQLTNLTNNFNSLDNLVRNNLEPTVTSLKSTVTGHTLQISAIQNDITNINNTDNQQNTQLTNLNNRVTALETSGPQLQSIASGNITGYQNITGNYYWYRLFTLSAPNDVIKPFMLVIRNFTVTSGTSRFAAVDLPSNYQFGWIWGQWNFYNNQFHTSQAIYNATANINSSNNRIDINFDTSPAAGQTINSDTFWFVIYGI
jgi:uncharacterized coiled-coil protein SlyX